MDVLVTYCRLRRKPRLQELQFNYCCIYLLIINLRTEGCNNSSEGILWQEDYYDSMNGDSYEQYFANSLCTNVPQGSLIVIDNGPYHSRNDETCPVSK